MLWKFSSTWPKGDYFEALRMEVMKRWEFTFTYKLVTYDFLNLSKTCDLETN